MSWDEKLFRTALHSMQSLFGQKAKPTLEEPHRVLLTDILSRLKTLACALSETAIEVSEAESVGGIVGSILFLPKQMAISTDRDLNLKAYIYRVAYSVTLSQSGLVLPEDLRENPDAQLLCSLLAVPLLRRELLTSYPGLKQSDIDLRVAETTVQNRQKVKEGRDQALQDLVLAVATGRSKEGWSSFAFQSIPEKVSDVPEVTRQLLAGLTQLPSGRETSTRLMPLMWGLVLPLNRISQSSVAERGKTPTAEEDSLPTGTEKKGKPKESVEEVRFSEDKEDESPLVHAFEKVKTADDYIGGKKLLDGADELEEQLEAIQELDLRKIIRTREKTKSIYRADLMLETGIGDSEDDSSSEVPQFCYDEWDFRSRAYKKSWCKLYVEKQNKEVTPDQVHTYVSDVLLRNRKQVSDLRRKFEEFTYVRRWRTRQSEGPEIDLDAIVDRHATLKSGHSPSRFLYLSRRPKERDFATLVLLDSSLSTDSWLQNRRVMDVLKESVLVLGEVIEDFRDRVSIGAFYSNTRTDCRYVEVKRFDEDWKRSQSKLVGLQPTGYTRIGPALRHATSILNKIPAKKKLLLLISDGKPTDYDRYEGRYGIEDIRQAIREASKDNVTVRALAIEAQAKFYLPQMFGVGNYQILPNPSMLAHSLAQLYGWLVV